MMIIVKTVFGDAVYESDLLEIPDKHYFELISEGYSSQVSKLINVRNAIRDRLKILPPQEVERYKEKLKKIGLEV